MSRPALRMLTASLVLSLSGCAGYQPHNGEEPYGYFSTRSEDGYLQIGYESWRPGSRERICGFAHRRVRELNLESVNVLNEHWEEQHEHAYNREQTAYVHTPNRGPREIELAAGYVSARVIRRCLLTLEQAAD